MDKEKPPIWETLTLFGSFIMLWAWYLARHSLPRGASLPMYWNILFALSLAALLFILVRRMKRVTQAMRDNAAFPPFPPDAEEPPRKPRR